MIKEYFHIAHLISKHLSGEVTPEESRFLDKWRKESKSHEQLFQKICSDEHYAQHEIRKMEFDSQAGWKGVETRIKRMELRRRHLKLLRYVALFIAPVLILVFALQDISVPHVMDGNQLLAAQQILPGGAKAILTLDNGETVYLDENADGRQLQLAGKQIQIDSTTLNYSAADGQVVQSALVYNKVEVPQGGEYTLVLNDGTKVHLNSMSSLRFPLTFEAGKREVELAGEAYFEVARNHEKPFMVKSPAMDVRVLGTSFNIKCRPDNSFAETTLIEGEVEVKDKSDKGRITLLPGQKAVLNRVTGRMQVKQVDPKMEIVWHNDLIPFEKSSIFQIAAALERFYGVKIILSPDVDSTNTYSGVLKKKDNIESVLNSLRNSIPFNYKKVDDNNIFISSETK